MEKRYSPAIVGHGRDQERQIRWQGDSGHGIEAFDDLIQAHFEEAQPWGLEASIDLFGCDPVAIRAEETIRAFAVALCDHIHMRRYLDPLLVHFGADERVSGFSLVQLIETSAVSGHFIEQVDAACLTIFSCAPYRPGEAARFCQQWFGAQAVQTSVVFRGPAQRNGLLTVQEERTGPGSWGTRCLPCT